MDTEVEKVPREPSGNESVWMSTGLTAVVAGACRDLGSAGAGAFVRGGNGGGCSSPAFSVSCPMVKSGDVSVAFPLEPRPGGELWERCDRGGARLKAPSWHRPGRPLAQGWRKGDWGRLPGRKMGRGHAERLRRLTSAFFSDVTAAGPCRRAGWRLCCSAGIKQAASGHQRPGTCFWREVLGTKRLVYGARSSYGVPLIRKL